MKLRYLAKRVLGAAWTARLGRAKQRMHAAILGATSTLPLEVDVPWCSRNTFQLVVETYRAKRSPRVHEYGAGASTLWHMRALFSQGGTLVAVEHDGAWAERVWGAVQAVARNELARDRSDVAISEHSHGSDRCLVITSSGEEVVRVELRERPPSVANVKGDGSFAAYRDYVCSLGEPADLVVVDGRARKACVRHVLESGLLLPGGALALFEAGRGTEGWLDAPALSGDSDYRPEVERLLALGGVLVDGDGYDSWAERPARRDFGSLSRAYPKELCLLRLPEGQKLRPASK